MTALMAHKICKACAKSLALSAFRAHPMSADRLQGKCKVCTTAYDRSRYLKTREKQIQNARAWNIANPEKVRISGKRADSKRKAYRAMSYREYDEKVKSGTPAWADESEMRMSYELSDVLSRGGVRFHVDHIVPIRGKSASGLHVQSNMRVIPGYLNRQKGNRLTVDLSDVDVVPTINLVGNYANHITNKEMNHG